MTKDRLPPYLSDPHMSGFDRIKARVAAKHAAQDAREAARVKEQRSSATSTGFWAGIFMAIWSGNDAKN